MPDYRLLVDTGLAFRDASDALCHIAETLEQKGICRRGFRQALLLREEAFPTGIMLEQHAVAIPHCEAEYALEPAIYLIRPRCPVAFSLADDDGDVDAELIIALVVTDPTMQITLLRTLFEHLQQPAFVSQLLQLNGAQLEACFRQSLQPLAA